MFASLFCHISSESGICQAGLKHCIKQECAQWISGLLGSKHVLYPNYPSSNLCHPRAAQMVGLLLCVLCDFISLTLSLLSQTCPVQGSQALLTTSDIAMQILSVRILREPSACERAIMAIHPITEPSAWDDTGDVFCVSWNSQWFTCNMHMSE